VTLSNKVILDQSVKQGPGYVKYDLEGFHHPRYSNGINALGVQFSEESTGEPSLEIESAFSAVLYASVAQEKFANYGSGGMAKPLIKLFHFNCL
jgi:hypothetical protein